MMFGLGQKGQQFEVFKLLIAAVVAVVILTLLLTIIGRINIFGQGNPQDEAGKIVDALTPTNGVSRTSEQVIFKTNDGISDRGIASKTRGTLSEEQICVLPGDFADQVPEKFQYNGNGKSVVYVGTSQQSAEVIAICDTGSEIANYRGGNYFEEYTGTDGISESWVSDCRCLQSDFRQKCCIVALKKFRG